MAKSAKGIYLIQNKTLHKIFDYAEMPYQDNKLFWMVKIEDTIGRRVSGLSKLTLSERYDFIKSYSKDFGNLLNPFVPPKHRDWQKGDKDGAARSIIRPIQVPKYKKPILGKIKAILTEFKLPWSYADGIAKKMFGVTFVEHCESDQMHSVLKALIYHQKRH